MTACSKTGVMVRAWRPAESISERLGMILVPQAPACSTSDHPRRMGVAVTHGESRPAPQLGVVRSVVVVLHGVFDDQQRSDNEEVGALHGLVDLEIKLLLN